MYSYGRIDVHQHIVPPGYAAWLAEQGITAGGMPLPKWTQQDAIGQMDELGIATGVVSVSTPGVHLGDDRMARAKAREVNEYAAEQVKDRPDRFGFFATLTLPDVAGALAEAAYALDELAADGVILLANVRGAYLGDPAFDPLMDELDRRSAVVFVHPSHLPGPGVEGIPAFLADFLLDTTRAAINLVRHGAMDRWPNLRIILSHGGGFVPYAAHRFAYTRLEGSPSPADFLAALGRFHFDTALSSSPAALPSLLSFAQPGHVMFGSDWPYAPVRSVRHFEGEWTGYDGVSEPVRAAVDRRNAERLFPRLSSKDASDLEIRQDMAV
ncbi:amidohydrolase [Kibdelosporangium aridum]|uniref:Amidohydrolase n=1 Tax=Kibdelosporangium aridum TaxID=2030 RepID=A0A428Z0H0_KIBAR|nr:amidohydrolase family protein [Kibdelosporangium aridum]RSM77785.1 amidohydrolase [Kibdelosporangium aridum]